MPSKLKVIDQLGACCLRCLAAPQIRLGCLASELVSSGVCANFVETYQVFRAANAPDAGAWGTKECRAPLGPLPAFKDAYTVSEGVFG